MANRPRAVVLFGLLFSLLFNLAFCKTLKRDVKALNEIKSSLGWRVLYSWVGDDPCGDGDLPPWSGVTCSVQGDYRVVTDLEVYAVSIVGPFPIAVTNLLDLQRLDLHNNKLTGPIPPQIGRLKRLKVLNLRWNKLQDVLPSEIGELRSLTHLYLSFNSFKGEIPKELANLHELRYLYLHENRFTGRIPAELGTLQNLRHLDVGNNHLVEDFVSHNPRAFCRAFVDNTPKCEVIVNNIAETFNAYIVQARAKHIMFILEDIRMALMERVVLKRATMENSTDHICPRIRLNLEKEKEEARNCFPVPSGNKIFQVTHRLDTLHVDMNEGKCTCRKWDVTGIPCCHAICCAAWLKEDPAKFVHPYLHKEHYLKSYEGAIFPCQGERHWPQHDFPLDPPDIIIGPGRPRKNRKRDPHEAPKKPGKLSKHGSQMSCGTCRQRGHNKRSCPNKNQASQPQPKRGRGRPRINPPQPQLEPEVQQMPIANHAQRGRGRTTSRGIGRGVGRGRGRAIGRGRGREKTATPTSNDNASTSRATSMVDVEAVHFPSQTSIGSSCLPQASMN